MKPVVNGLKQQYEGKVEFRLVNADKATEAEKALMQKYKVTAVPTFIFLGSDGNMATSIIGEATEAKMQSTLDSLK